VGTTIVGGMLLSTVLNLFFIPTLYVILSTMLSKLSRKKVPKLEHAESVR
jgi:HAE1 family hydrophobic/amphiphilic exporter-1